MPSEHWQLERGVLGAHNLQGNIFKFHSELENALTLFLIPFLFYNFVKVFKSYKYWKWSWYWKYNFFSCLTRDLKHWMITLFFLISKVTIKTRILPSQPQETPESLMFNCIAGLNTVKLQNCLIIFLVTWSYWYQTRLNRIRGFAAYPITP